jgi:RNA polymerase sigma-70 factor, ECF subfamily
MLLVAAQRIRAADGISRPAISPVASLPRTPNAALRNHDPEAWHDFFEAEHAAIYRYALSRLADAQDAEEVTSEAFAEAWENAASFEDIGLPARAWLFGIARNLVNRRRRRLFQRPPTLALEAFDCPADEPAMAPDLIDLARAIAALEKAHAEVITLRFIHDLSLQETAAAMGTTVDVVKGRQARALVRLRKQLDVTEAGARK